MRNISTTLIVAAGLLAAASGTARADFGACTGRDIMADLKVAEPKSYSEVRASADSMENGKTLLWKIEREATEEKPALPVSYIFGTIRLSDDRLQKLSPKVSKAIDTSRLVAVEIDDLSMDRIAEALQTLRAKATLPEGETLDKLLSPAELAKVAGRLEMIGLKGEDALRVRPWVVQVALDTSDCERKRQRQGMRSLDKEIAQRAENRGVGTIGLETVELMLEALAEVPDDQQVRILKASIATMDRLDDVQETTVRRYLERDLGAIWPMQVAFGAKNGAPKEAFEAFAQGLLVQRNVVMRDRALMHLKQGGVFLAVNAMNLPGKQGLVEMLKDEGFTLTPVE